MKRLIIGFLLAIPSLQAIAHEGHGIDGSAVAHFLSLPHLLVPICVGLGAAGLFYIVVKYIRERQ